jgi:hypothetical protein
VHGGRRRQQSAQPHQLCDGKRSQLIELLLKRFWAWLNQFVRDRAQSRFAVVDCHHDRGRAISYRDRLDQTL